MDTARIQILQRNQSSKVMFFENESYILRYSNTVTLEERPGLEEEIQIVNGLCRKQRNCLIKATKISFGDKTVKIVDKFELLRREQNLLEINGQTNHQIAILSEEQNQNIFIKNCIKKFLPSFLGKLLQNCPKFSSEGQPLFKDQFFKKIFQKQRIRRKFLNFLKKKISLISFRSVVLGRNANYQIKNNQKLLDILDETLGDSSLKEKWYGND